MPGHGLDWLSGEAQPKPRNEIRYAVRVDLQRITSEKSGKRLWLDLGNPAEIDQFPEELFKTSGRNDLKNPRRAIPGVPKRVPLVARLEDYVPGLPVSTSSPSNAPTSPSSTKLYSSSRACR